MSTTTYGPGGIAEGFCALALNDSNGNLTVIKIPQGSTISITTLRTAPSPSEVYSGADALAAATAVQQILED